MMVTGDINDLAFQACLISNRYLHNPRIVCVNGSIKCKKKEKRMHL